MYIYIIFQISYTLSIQCIYTISYRLYIQIQTCLCRRNKNLSIQCLYDIQTILAYLSIQHLFYIDEKTSISYRHIDCRPWILSKLKGDEDQSNVVFIPMQQYHIKVTVVPTTRCIQKSLFGVFPHGIEKNINKKKCNISVRSRFYVFINK